MRHLPTAVLCLALSSSAALATFHARPRDFKCLLDGHKPAGKNF